MKHHALWVLSLLSIGSAWGQSVGLTGVMGNKALLVVDGSKPKAVGAGESHQGVTVVLVQGNQTVVRIGNQQRTLRLGDTPVSLGAAAGSGGDGTRIMLTAGSGGHFFPTGQINGQTVQFLLDTGATNVAMSTVQADRIGLRYKSAPTGRSQTANGEVTTWRVTLDSVRVGDVVVHNVEASVLPGPMSHVLLGNSFLNRFQMTRNNDQMILEKRY